MEDKKGVIWFGTKEGVFRLKEDGSLITLITDRGLVNNSVNSILTKIEQELFGSAQKMEFRRFDQDGKFFISYTTAQGLANNSVMSICEDKKGNLWFGTYGGGVSSLDRDGKNFTNYTTAQGLPNNVCEVLLKIKWEISGSEPRGGCMPAGSCQESFNKFILPSRDCRKIVSGVLLRIKQGNLWVGTAKVEYSGWIQQKTITTYTTEQGLSNNSGT